MLKKNNDIFNKMYLMLLMTFILFITIVVQIFYLQLYEGNKWQEKAEKEIYKQNKIKSIRGNIYSCDEKLLATSAILFDVYWDSQIYMSDNKTFNAKIDTLSDCLSKLFRIRSKAYYKKLLLKAKKKKQRFLLLKRNVNYSDISKLKTFPIFRLGKYKGGLILKEKYKRLFPFYPLAYRTLGWDKPGTKNDCGLEGSFSKILSGKDGKRLEQKIANGEWKPVDFNKYEVEPINGKDIITTLDISIQDITENALRKQLIKSEASQGCAIVMEVATGKIKAIANLTFDKKSKKYKELYNIAISKKYEPGSVFKTASMISILEDKKIKLNDKVNTFNGSITYFGRDMRDSHKIGDGLISVREAFEKSSNVGMSKIIFEAYKDKPGKFINNLYNMNLNKPVGIEIEGERKPYIKNPKSKYWYKTSLPWMSIGYELELTPLQILTFYNAIANNGKMVKPFIVKEIKDGANTVKTFKTEIIKDSICSKSTIKKIQSLLIGVVENGTAKNIKSSDYKIAGKTGTAKISLGKSGYSHKYNATFVGYFPAENPRYSCFVVINKPTKGGYYGSSVAAPVFKEISDLIYATHLDKFYKVEPFSNDIKYPLAKTANLNDLKVFYNELNYKTEKTIINQDWVGTNQKNDTVRFYPKRYSDNTIPNLKGMCAKDAIFILENMGLKVKIEGKGRIKKQSLRPGSKVKKESYITLKLSKI